MSFFYVIVAFFQKGGAFMYPILFVLALGSAIVIEKFIFLRIMSAHGSDVWDKIKALIIDTRIDDALVVCKDSPKSLLKILSAGMIAHSNNGTNDGTKDDIQNSLDEVMMEEIPRLERRTHYIPVLANVATLLGLLGTIMGLIEAFKAIAVAEPAQKSTMLAQGVSTAMNTTAFGLIVAIPLMLAYSVLQSKTTTIIDSLDEYSIKLLNLFGKHGK